MASETLKLRQDAAQVAYTKMLDAIVGYSPCGKLTIEDAQYIARTAQRLVFDASECFA